MSLSIALGRSALCLTQFLFLGILSLGVLPSSAQDSPPNYTYVPQISDQRVLILYKRAFAAFKMGDYLNTLGICQQAESFDANCKDILHLEALSLSQAGDHYNAMVKFRQALACDYNFVPCRNNYGIFLLNDGKTKEAQKEFEESV